MKFNLLTLFPEMFPGALGQSLSGKALEKGLWSYNAVNIRDFAEGVHKSVDDTPYGGGAGMVMRADVIEKALLSLPPLSSLRKQGSGNHTENSNQIPDQVRDDTEKRIYMSPRGKPLTQSLVKELSQESNLTLLCGRYEGVDQRLLDAYAFEEISIGDYVLSGGEPAALILMDACIRLLPGVMGNEDTPNEESFSEESGGLLEYPHYTKPAEWTDASGKTHSVPEILTSGHHENIKTWRREQSETLTRARRPDLVSFSQEGTKSQSFKEEKDIEDIAKEIVDCAYQTHKKLGPGLLESVYEVFFSEELKSRGLKVEKQVPISINIDDLEFKNAFKADLIINNLIIIELKSVEHLLPVHKAQTISYLKMTGLPIGFLINFNSDLIKNGIRRFINTK